MRNCWIEVRNVKNDIESTFIEELRRFLLENDFPLDAKENNPFDDKVKTLEPINANSEEDDEQQQKLHLENYRIIGNFPQGDSAIYFDYEELLKKTKSGDTDHGIIGQLT